MLLAWLDPHLHHLVRDRSRLRNACGGRHAAIEDLLALVSASPTLRDLGSFRSVSAATHAGELKLKMEECALHARLLDADGQPVELRGPKHLASSGGTRSLLIVNLEIDGRSLQRLAS